MNRLTKNDPDHTAEEHSEARILQIGNYPPPVCGWAMQTKALVEEIRRRGNVCCVLNLNENRKKRSSEYIDVQGGFDYLRKLIRFASTGYRFQVHVNGQSAPGYMLALIAAIVGRLARKPVALSWRGGLEQKYFPRRKGLAVHWAFRLLFRLAGQISCNSEAVKHAIEWYGIVAERVVAIPAFSRQNLEYTQVPLSPEVETFLQDHCPVFFCYVSFRPEYQLPMLRNAMSKFRQSYPRAGFVWLGFPSKELLPARRFAAGWSTYEREGLLLMGNLPHDAFLTLLARCFAYIRTPVCDGVAASLLESIALGVPVVASENNNRPPQVTTYCESNADDLCKKLTLVTECYEQMKEKTQLTWAEDNIARTVDWLLEDSSFNTKELTGDFASAD